MKIFYTNISPVTNAYTNLNHIYYLKKQKPQKVYLCVWDNFVYEHSVFEGALDHTTNKVQKLQENVEVLEKLMTSLGMDYKIIYLSEAMDRFFKNSEHHSTLQKILSKFKIENLKRGFEIDYIPFKDISLSKINYIIADYLIAMHLPELFPELCSTAPNYYLTSERFKIFHKGIDSHLSTTYARYKSPKPIFVSNVPVIISEKEEIPSMEMSKQKIKEIVNCNYKDKKILKSEINDLTEVFGHVLKSSSLKKAKKKEIVDAIAFDLYDYFSKILEIVQKENAKGRTKSLFISNVGDFEKQIKPLNNLKLQILSYCDGNHTSLDIARKTGIKLSTISTYFNYLKKQKLITGNRKPKRVVDSIVINLKEIV